MRIRVSACLFFCFTSYSTSLFAADSFSNEENQSISPLVSQALAIIKQKNGTPIETPSEISAVLESRDFLREYERIRNEFCQEDENEDDLECAE